MAASSSQKCDVFPSFRGEDVRTGFLSHLRMELDCSGFINTFNDNGIKRSCEIGPELLWAIREARISIVIFSENYASSKWCLDELAEIHNCYKKSNQMVIPVFYKVDPSEVRKQNGEFGKVFMKTCEGKSDGDTQRWKEALTDVANLAGEHLQNWSDEASMVKKIANDVFNKLLPPSNCFGDFVGIEAHIETMESILCLESEEEVRMIGIWGQSGIGKSTLGRALFTQLSPKFPLYAFLTYKSTDQDVFGMKFFWENQLLAEIFDKNIKEKSLGMVERMLKHKKVLIVLDDVVKPTFLETLVGKTEWFGRGSRIIVITQDRQILKGHKIDLLYEVKIPPQDIALKIFCQSAFVQDSPPEDFKELTHEVVRLAGGLPLGLSVLGKSLKERTKEEWTEFLLDLQNGLDGDIIKPLRVSYDRLEEKYKKIFVYIACLFNGKNIKFINDFFGDLKVGVKRLAEKSLIRITPNEKSYWSSGIRPDEEIVEMHNLLEKLGREINREESEDPGKRRFLMDAKEIEDVFTNQTGTGTLLGIIYDEENSQNSIDEKLLFLHFNSDDTGPQLVDDKEIEDVFTNQTGTGTLLGISFNPSNWSIKSIDEKSFKGMFNLQFLQIHSDYNCPQLYLVYLPPKLKWLDWQRCPLKCLPSNFKAEFLVELRMSYSKLEKLWEGTQQLGSLKTIIMRHSCYLKEVPDLSKAINLKNVDFTDCNLLESFPSPLNSESLEYLSLIKCSRLKNFPQIEMRSLPHGVEIRVYDCLWNKNLPGPIYLDCLRRCHPLKFLPGHLAHLEVKGIKLEKLWEGVQPLGSLQNMDLSYSKNLKKIPNFSKATNLTDLDLSHCISLEILPSTIKNLQKLKKLEMKECTGLKVLPVDVNLSSLKFLNLTGCSSLTSFPQISSSIEELYLDDTAIEEVPCCIEMFQSLTKISMRCCSKLKNISPKIFRLPHLKLVNFADCEGIVTALSDATMVAPINDPCETIEKGNKVEKRRSDDHWYFNFGNCFKLDREARELIIQSSFKPIVVLPGGEVPTYFKHRAYRNSLTVRLPHSSLSHNILRFNVCVVVEPPATSWSSLYLKFRFDGEFYKHAVDVVGVPQMWKNHLVFFSFKFHPKGLTSILDSSDVEFEFEGSVRIEEFGIRLLDVSPFLDHRDGRRSETECNDQSGEKCDVVETERSNKQMQITSGKSEENFNLSCGKIVTDTGESSSISFYPCLEGEPLCIDCMITEQQDAQLPIVVPGPKCIWQSSKSWDFSSGDRRYVFPSCSGEDVRKWFLSHLFTAFQRRSINLFIDNGRELISAIREAKIAIVLFSKNYAASTCCLNELVEIHKCSKELDQMVIPVFYDVYPSDVRKQTGEFGESFMKTCEGKTDDVKQRWKQAVTDVANMAGEQAVTYGLDEWHMVDKIANDVSNILLSSSNGFGDFFGIKAHIA